MEENHEGICVESIIRKNTSDFSIPIPEHFCFGEALESIFPLLDIIFNFLNDSDLKNVSQVKSSWRDIVDRILRNRSKPSWVTCFKKKKVTVRNFSNNLHYNNANIGILLYDHRRLKLDKYICVHTDTSKLCKMTLSEYLSTEVVAAKINYCLLSCPKVVSHFCANNSSGAFFDGIFLPQIPGIRVSMFHCNPAQLKTNRTVIENNIKDNEELRCLLLFSLSNLTRSIDKLFELLFKNTKPENVAVGGGVIRGMQAFQNLPQHFISRSGIFCIAFLQENNTNPDFNAASFIVHGNDNTNEEFENELLKFKRRVILRTNNVAIRVCCGAKLEKDVESIIFNKLFPDTPLLGLEADGEIGWNSFNKPGDGENDESKPKKSKRLYPKVEHQWSTVFVLMTWGEVISDN